MITKKEYAEFLKFEKIDFEIETLKRQKREFEFYKNPYEITFFDRGNKDKLTRIRYSDNSNINVDFFKITHGNILMVEFKEGGHEYTKPNKDFKDDQN